MRFRLKTDDGNGNRTGKHLMGPVRNRKFRRTVLPGEVVESDQPLDQLFKNKFERIDDATPKPEPDEEQL